MKTPREILTARHRSADAKLLLPMNRMNATLTSPCPLPSLVKGAERENVGRFRGSKREICFGAFSPRPS
jgi:hypothetical protein